MPPTLASSGFFVGGLKQLATSVGRPKLLATRAGGLKLLAASVGGLKLLATRAGGLKLLATVGPHLRRTHLQHSKKKFVHFFNFFNLFLGAHAPPPAGSRRTDEGR
jgi:hypothetical protein